MFLHLLFCRLHQPRVEDGGGWEERVRDQTRRRPRLGPQGRGGVQGGFVQGGWKYNRCQAILCSVRE